MRRLVFERKNLLHKKCPECGSLHLVVDNNLGEIVCENCGFIISSNLNDRKQEWRAFTLEENQKKARTGPPFTYMIHDKGLSTVIGRGNRDAHGVALPVERKAELYRLRRWHRRIKVSGSRERNLASAMSIISRIGDKLSLPRNTLESASMIYRRALSKKITRGRSIETLAAATLYIACRICGTPKRLKDFAEVSNIDRKILGRAYRFLVKNLDLNVPQFSSERYLSKFSNELEVNGRVEALAHKIIRAAKKLRLTSGKVPAGTAAAAIYIASLIAGDHLTQKEVAETTKVTEVTVRKRYKEITQQIQLNINL